MNGFVLDFEKPLLELEKRIAEMREYDVTADSGVEAEIKKLEERARRLREDIYSKLTRWQRVQLARHPQRPYTLDYVDRMLDAMAMSLDYFQANFGPYPRDHYRVVEFPGYREYAARVRYRLLPGIW